MNQEEFTQFVATASRRAIHSNGQIGHLVLTQKIGTEPEIREPEMRHALAQQAENQNLWYGIEVPTKKQYRFVEATGERRVAARHDFVILEQAHPDSNRSILLELKREQPATSESDGQILDCPAIRKDFEKLLLENATDGKGMLHILHAVDDGTLPSLQEKYTIAHGFALNRAQKVIARPPLINNPPANRWFTLFILVHHLRGLQGQNRPFLF
jgi:hypothetical protein